MAQAAARTLSITRGASGIAAIVAPLPLSSALGFTTAQASKVLCQLVGAREIGLGILLWPRSNKIDEQSDGASRTLLTSQSGLGHDSKTSISYLGEATRPRDTILACIVVDMIDVVLCALGFVGGDLTTQTVISLGGIGVVSVVVSAFLWNMFGRMLK